MRLPNVIFLALSLRFPRRSSSLASTSVSVWMCVCVFVCVSDDVEITLEIMVCKMKNTVRHGTPSRQACGAWGDCWHATIAEASSPWEIAGNGGNPVGSDSEDCQFRCFSCEPGDDTDVLMVFIALGKKIGFYVTRCEKGRFTHASRACRLHFHDQGNKMSWDTLAIKVFLTRFLSH